MNEHQKAEILEMLTPVKERLKSEITTFGKKPLGSFVRIAGQRYLAMKMEKRDFNWNDLAAMVNEAAAAERDQQK